MSTFDGAEQIHNGNGVDGRLSTSVALELASVLDRPATDLAPLAGSVDPEAIDRLFDGAAADADIEVSFEHEGCRIEIGPSSIDVTPLGTSER